MISTNGNVSIFFNPVLLKVFLLCHSGLDSESVFSIIVDPESSSGRQKSFDLAENF